MEGGAGDATDVLATAGQRTCLIELTDGRQVKPWKVSDDVESCTIASLLKEGKNKFRRKFRFVVYSSSLVQSDQWLVTDEDLQRVLRQSHDDGSRGRRLRLLLTDKAPPPQKREEQQEGEPNGMVTVPTVERGLCYVIGDEDATESDAITQLKRASELKGCLFCIGMPDLHPGKGIPIGAVVMTEETIAYPQLIDNDIGCGMSFVETSLRRGKLTTKKAQNLASSLQSIDGPYSDSQEYLMELCAEEIEWGHDRRRLKPLPPLDTEYHYKTLGTVGGGNHFAELQEFDDILDPEALERYGIDVDRIHLLVHSGSRGLGSQFLKEFCEQAAAADGSKPKHGHYGVDTSSILFQHYLRNHDIALNFAARNRRLIAQRLLDQINNTPGRSPESPPPTCKIDIYHNFLEPFECDSASADAMEQMAQEGLFPKNIPQNVSDEEDDQATRKRVGWMHRKGATPTNRSPILVIPGSRGSLSYLVEVNAAAQHGSGYSLAHGAGRRLNRSSALKCHRQKFPNTIQLLQTDLGGVVICEKKDLIYEEAPDSYKNVDGIAKCLAEEITMAGGDGKDNDDKRRGLVRILATLRPVLTYKYKDPHEHK